jgi:hypothetical protein
MTPWLLQFKSNLFFSLLKALNNKLLLPFLFWHENYTFFFYFIAKRMISVRVLLVICFVKMKKTTGNILFKGLFVISTEKGEKIIRYIVKVQLLLLFLLFLFMENQNPYVAQQTVEQQQVEAFKQIFDSCPGRTVGALGVGYGLGYMMGLFLNSADYNQSDAYLKMTTREQVKYTFKDMFKKSHSGAKGWAKIGATFSFSECVIESYRGKHDIYVSFSTNAEFFGEWVYYWRSHCF